MGRDYSLEELIKEAVRDREIDEYSMAEVYSPPRVVAEAIKRGIKGLWSLDLKVNDPIDGKPWDFAVKEKRNRCIEKVIRDKPSLIIGSPMCTAFSKLQDLNFARMNKEDVKKVQQCV